MKRILIDTNIEIDLLAIREPFYKDAAKLFSLADKNKAKLSISALSIANTNYVLLKSNTTSESREILRKFKILTSVLPLNDKIIDLSLNNDEFNDFEDAIQYYTAIENNIDLIITRNLKDFRKSQIPVMTASEYLTTIK
jgi:predicted nucleic acid-binding protein